MLEAPEDEIRAVPRSALTILHVLSRCTSGSATYSGLAFALGLTTNAVRTAVRLGVEAGVVEVRGTGRGRGCKAVVRLTSKAARINAYLFGEEAVTQRG